MRDFGAGPVVLKLALMMKIKNRSQIKHDNMKTVKIVSGNRGWHLRVNGLFISQGFTSDIKAIKPDIGIPYGATEWVDVQAIRAFWHKYRPLVIAATTRPYTSEHGRLIPMKATIKAGDTLTARAIGDSDCIYKAEILARSKSMVTVKVQGQVKRCKVKHDSIGNELIMALGTHSMAPTFRAK